MTSKTSPVPKKIPKKSNSEMAPAKPKPRIYKFKPGTEISEVI
jgi:hypothetical protein